MVWFAPFTFIAGDSLTAEDLNKYLYHNMQETLAGKLKTGALPTTAEQFFSTNGVNSIIGREIKADNSTGFGTRTSSSFGATTTADFGFSNPSVTVTTDTRALVIWGGALQLITDGAADANEDSALCGVNVSGASSIAASDTYAIRMSGVYPSVLPGADPTATHTREFTTFRWFTNLTPGSNTFTLHYRSTNGRQLSVQSPNLIVIPFG